MRKSLSLIFGLFFSLFMIQPVAASNQVDVYAFVGETCPHCKHLEQDIITYAQDKDYIKLHFYEIYNNSANQKLINQVAAKLNTKASGVPFVIIGDQTSLGYSAAVKDDLINRINYCHQNQCANSIQSLVQSGQEWDIVTKPNSSITPDGKPAVDKDIIDLPFGIKLNRRTASLPVMTVVIGLLDGFNPCAMWALVFIITLLIGLKNRQKMWAYGLAFIVTSAAVYTLFMVAWLSVFRIVGLVTPIRIGIGLVALGIGAYYLYQYCQKGNVCKVSTNKSRLRWFEKAKQSVESSSFALGLVGVILLAVAVNMVELVCSAGLPAVYTSILSAANLNAWQYAFYIGLYILFFMLDDLIVFAIAVKTMSLVNIDGKYSKFSRLIGGALMIIIGLLLIFAPQFIMFG